MSKRRAVAKNMEYLEYELPLNDEEKKWARQFYNEYYDNGSNNPEEPIMTIEEHLVDARRIHNSLYRDALSVALNTNRTEELTSDQTEVLNLSADELDWEYAYSQGGYELAAPVIFSQAKRDIKAGQDIETVLSRFYVKMEKLRKQLLKEKRKIKTKGRKKK